MGKDAPHLSRLLREAAEVRPNHPAVEDERGHTLSYAQLDRAADRLATRLVRWGVGREDRVGLYLPKGLEAVATIHGILRAGAAYVPVDATAPPARGVGILADAGVRSVVVSANRAGELRSLWSGPGPLPRLVIVGAEGDPGPDASWESILADDSPTPLTPSYASNDLAYVLYTSGSTGRPKGVMLSHANAFCFLDWCDRTLDTRPGDRFASHAPFHFDLSVFDLYVCCRRSGTLVLIGETLGKDPVGLGAYLKERRPDVWYSAPSILALLAEYGGIGDEAEAAPRLVLFAGEVFPIRPLKRLRSLWPDSELWNLYGPTETNVCTAQAIPETISEDRAAPFPIGRVCSPLRARVVDESGRALPVGDEGELMIAGAGVMRGYFGRQDLDAQAFVLDPDGTRWYRTGDRVVLDASGVFTYRGRRDRMVKKRGYRIELGEIESALDRHEDVERAAVVARSDESGVAISAFVAMKPRRKASIIAMKRHCSEFLPHYMIPDRITFLPSLPTTSTDKVDYQGLVRLTDDAMGQ
jgi:amino acid adenylation domain-containing protein